VSFDEGTYDLRIDGKNRRDNGKGVRAITHAAFKVALLMFCRERGLPHPGLLVLDTPMLTYRDPLRSREGPLGADEQAIRNTSLKMRRTGRQSVGPVPVVAKIAKPTESKLVKSQAESGEICSVEVEEK
jgi:hypothetical protein